MTTQPGSSKPGNREMHDWSLLTHFSCSALFSRSDANVCLVTDVVDWLICLPAHKSQWLGHVFVPGWAVVKTRLRSQRDGCKNTFAQLCSRVQVARSHEMCIISILFLQYCYSPRMIAQEKCSALFSVRSALFVHFFS